jgi:hypothetical protein
VLHKANRILSEQRFLALFTEEGGNIIDNEVIVVSVHGIAGFACF